MMHTAVVLWIVSAVVCVGKGDPHEGHDVRTSLVMSANNDFAFRLYKKVNLLESQDRNIIVSPASVSVVLAAVSVGARGETHQQLFNGLGFSNSQLTQTEVNQAFRALLANTTSHQDIDAGTAFFVDNMFTPQQESRNVLKQFYSAEIFQVNLKKPTDSTNFINKYVADKTNGKIPKLIHSLDLTSVMYLINYIYYKGAWKTPFDPQLTFQDEFSLDENNKVQVQMMKMEKAIFETYHDQEASTKVLHLPFNNSYSMLLLLPDNMATLERDISPAHVTKWMKGMASSEHNIYVPKFSIKTSYKLKEVLTEMGMSDIFNDGADLSGIAERLSVTEAVHQATLDIDEAGATASAGTSGRGRLMIVPNLKFDRPFMVIILERGPENVLFVGKIINPNI